MLLLLYIRVSSIFQIEDFARDLNFYNFLFYSLALVAPVEANDWSTVGDMTLLRRMAVERNYIKKGTSPPVGDVEAMKGYNSKHDICYNKSTGEYAVMLKGCKGDPYYV